MWQHKKHIIIINSKFITTYTILSSTLSHNIHNMRIHMSNTHCQLLIYIEVIHIISYTYKT
jgi:hypothetical protein